MSVITVDGLSAFVSVGDVVNVECEPPSLGEVISVDTSFCRVRLVDESARVPIKTCVSVRPGLTVRPCLDWCGRVLDYLGRPIDGKGPLSQGLAPLGVNDPPSHVMSRVRVLSPVATGVHAIDVFTPLCVGQRLGVFAGSGVGKTTLLSMIARTGKFDRVVLGLVGERGREVREFVEDVLGSGFGRAVVVASTGDESAMRRRLSAHTAMAIARQFRSEGCSVLLILDSLTRYAQAVRDIALSAGELPVSRGYPVKVLHELAKLLEHAGPGIDGEGSITAIFSILIEGDDHNDPIADAVRGILDGHIVLDRTIANRGLYPAIDIRSSISRLARHAWTPDDAGAVKELLRLVSIYEDTRDLRSLGAYTAGRDHDIDLALRMVPALYRELTQFPSLMEDNRNTFCDAASLLTSLLNRL